MTLIFALFVAFVVLMLSIYVLDQATHNQSRAAYDRKRLTATNAAEAGLSEDQIALCFEYAVEDAPLDFSKTLGRTRGPEVKRPQP